MFKVRGWLEAGEARCKPVPLDRNVSCIDVAKLLDELASYFSSNDASYGYERRRHILEKFSDDKP
jgi:hypothetical protein